LGFNVFAVDPGVTTGWALLEDIDLATIPQGECDLTWVAGQMGGSEDQQAIDMFRIIMHVMPAVVVIEDFIPQMLNKERHFLSPVRVTSKLELLLFQADRRHTKQMPSMAMSTITDDYMRSATLWTPGQPHANDAVRHGVTFLRRAVMHPALVDVLLSPLGLDL